MDQKTQIKQYMTACPHSVGLEQDANIACHMMRRYGVHHLPVQSGGKLVGVVSDRDIKFAGAWSSASGKNLDLEDVYTPEPYTVSPETPLSEALDRMVRDRIGCVLVQEQDKLLGIFTTTDACRVLSDLLRKETPR